MFTQITRAFLAMKGISVNKSRLILLCGLLSMWILLSGKFCGGGGDPCAQDKFSCDNNLSSFVLDPTCTLTGELEVVAGQGSSQFEALAPGEAPQAFYGSQGGSHYFLGLQVKNVDLEQYDKLKVDVVYHRSQLCLDWQLGNCGEEPCSEMSPSLTTDWGEETSCEYYNDGSRELVLGAKNTILINGDGVVEEYGIMVFRDGYADSEGSVNTMVLTVEDPCGRVGRVVHDYSE
jgi:hypothetical protein